MKSPSAKKNMNQVLSLNSRPITIRNLPKVRIRDFDGWFTATQGVSTVSNAVSQWDNLVPGGANLSQPIAAQRPALSEINGLTALDFDGETGGKGANSDNVEGGLNMMDGIGTGDFYIAFVLAGDAVAGTPATQVLFSKMEGGLSLTRFECRFGNTRFSIHNGSSTLAASATGQLVQGQTTLVEFHRLNGTLQIFKNGTSIASESDSTDITASSVVTIGKGTQNPFNGQIGEFICKAGTVPVKTRQVIEALMATKWNIGAARTAKARGRAAGFGILPASNRFRNRPPRF